MTYSEVQDVHSAVQKSHTLLEKLDRGTHGAALAMLVAIYLAMHPKQERKDVLKLHVHSARRMVEIALEEERRNHLDA